MSLRLRENKGTQQRKFRDTKNTLLKRSTIKKIVPKKYLVVPKLKTT